MSGPFRIVDPRLPDSPIEVPITLDICREPTAVDERIARLERTVAKLVAFVGAMPEGDEVMK